MNCTKQVLKTLALGLVLLAGTAFAALPSTTVTVSTMAGVESSAVGIYRITSDTTWTSDNYYLMDGVVVVEDGVTLTIEPGTIIRGKNSDAVVGSATEFRPGVLIVSRGGKLIANGTADQPIIFTDQWDNHFPWQNNGTSGTSVSRTWNYRNNGTTWVSKSDTYNYGSIGDLHGVWGGIVLCGKAYVNNDGMALGSATWTVEGMATADTFIGGGTDDDDSSGELSYVQIRYGGSVLKDGGEINGLTMYGVGRGTKIHHVEVYNNQDDGFEWFGGTVASKYLVGWGMGDDIFDSDAGFRGKNQFLLGVQRDLGGGKIESGAGDKGLEMDGFEKNFNSSTNLLSASLWANLTVIGNNSTGTGNDANRNMGIIVRDNASPRIYNSIVMDFDDLSALIENRTGSDTVTGNGITANAAERFGTLLMPNAMHNDRGQDYFYGDGALADDVHACIRGTTFWHVPGGLTDTVTAGGSAWTTKYKWIKAAVGDGKGPYVSTGANAYSGWTAVENWNTDSTAETSANMPIKARTLVPYTKTASSGSHAMAIDPRASGVSEASALVVPDAWLTPVRFVGAFPADKNWAKTWTTIGSMGVFSDDDASGATEVTVGGLSTLAATTPAGGTVTNTIVSTVTVTNGVNGIVYENNGSAVAGTEANMVAANDISVTPVLNYTIAAAGTYQLQTCTDLSVADWGVVKTIRVSADQIPQGGLSVALSDIDASAEGPSASRFYRLVKTN